MAVGVDSGVAVLAGDDDGLSKFSLQADGLIPGRGDRCQDGQGRVIGDAGADWRNAAGYVLSGPEYLTVFQGTTGKALSTVNYTAFQFLLSVNNNTAYAAAQQAVAGWDTLPADTKY